jgi:hypothetical protein
MKQVVQEVRQNGGGTDAVNRHPVCRLYSEQIAWLAGAGSCANHRSYLRAIDACKRLAAEQQTIADEKAQSAS